MKLIKDSSVFNTDNDTVIRAFKLNGYKELVEEVKAEVKEEKPKKATKK